MARFYAHDVRKLHACAVCEQLGAHGSELATKLDVGLVLKAGPRRFVHPHCLTRAELLALPAVELGEVRLSDVEPATLEAIFERRAQ